MKLSNSNTVAIHLLMAALLSLLPTAFAGDVYEWTDENGTVHFSDSPNDIPPQYQDQFKTRKFKEDKVPEKSKSAVGDTSLEDRTPGVQEEKQKLNRHEIPYEAYEGKAKRIILSVTLNDSVTAPMALDTGATGMFISSQLAEKLGIFSENEGKLLITAGGIGGSAPAIRTIIDRVEVGGAKDYFIPKGLRDFADQQYNEADKLFDKLNQYARQHAVPMHWRKE